MNSKIYRQADSRWSKLPYPTKSYSFGGNGCGACAVLHCIIELPEYANWTPKNIQPYMKQFATKGHGTLWAGIKTALEHFGYTVRWNQNDSMSTIFKTIEKAPIKRGVILFGSTHGPDGTIWTGSGHYISFVDYKVEGGKHYFYLKDSGGRKHDKWWCYEKSMRGDVRQVFVCTGLKETAKKPTSTYSGEIPTPTIKLGSSGYNVKKLQKFLNWYHPSWNLATDGKAGNATITALMEFQGTEGIEPDGIYGKRSQAKAKAYCP